MTDPIFVLGCHRSGTSVVAGLLHEACGVAMGELMPPTVANPLGYYEAQGVVDAHRALLYQMERDWTCPPVAFRPDEFDLGALGEEIETHRSLAGVWAVKDPRLMFLLPAWRHLGVERARLVAVVRAPSDTIGSIAQRDGVRQDRAEAIVDVYLRRLAEIASQAAVAVIRFSNDADDVLGQVRSLASALRLEWDESTAGSFFEPSLIQHQTPHQATTPAYDAVIDAAAPYETEGVPATDLGTLSLRSAPEWPLETHLGVRYSLQRNELWDLATFSSVPDPDVVEFVLDGARLRRPHRPGVRRLHQIEITSPEAVGAVLARHRLRPHGVLANGVLAQRTEAEVAHFFRSLHAATQVFSEVVVDVPEPTGEALLSVEPPASSRPVAATVREVAAACGWDHLTTQRVSPGRLGMVFRKQIPTDRDTIPVATELLAVSDRLAALEADLADLRLGRVDERLLDDGAAIERERRRADAAEEALRRLRGRRSVRIALAAARPFGGWFRRMRAWKTGR